MEEKKAILDAFRDDEDRMSFDIYEADRDVGEETKQKLTRSLYTYLANLYESSPMCDLMNLKIY